MVMNPDAAAQSVARASAALWVAFTGGVLVVAALGYSVTGSPGRATAGNAPQATAAAVETAVPAVETQSPEDQITGIVDRLAQRLKSEPGDAAGWSLLARAYLAMGRYDEAVSAFKTALPLAAENADLLADYADAMAGQNKGQLGAEARRQIDRALLLEPVNPKALALSGRAAFDAGDYPSAVTQWEKVARALPPDSALRAPLQLSIAEARRRAGLPVVEEPVNPPAASTASSTP